MKPDQRYFMLIVNEKDMGDETIYKHTNSMKKRSETKYPDVKTMLDNVIVPNKFDGSMNNFLNNAQMMYKRAAISAKLRKLTDKSEIVIHGHGDVDAVKINGVGPTVLADALVRMGLAVSCRINITGCDLGRNAQVPPNHRVDAGASTLGTRSFAHVFQKELWREAQICCEVHARTSWVVIGADGRKQTVKLLAENVSASGVWPHEMEAKQRNSKILFKIDGAGVQTMTYAYAD
jgi:hypothetical protein